MFPPSPETPACGTERASLSQPVVPAADAAARADFVPPTRDLLKTVARLGGPSVLENLLTSGILLTDTLMLARLEPNTLYLAATGITGVVYWRVCNIAGCTQIGAGAYVARRWGEERFAEAGRATTYATLLAIAIGVVAMALVWPIAHVLFLTLTNHDEAVTRTATGYFGFLMAALPVRLALMSIAACMRAAGDTRTPLLLVVQMLVLNFFLNWVFVYGNLGAPRMLMNGSGLATAICYVLSFLTGALLLRRGLRPRRLVSANRGQPVVLNAQTDAEEFDAALVPTSDNDGTLRFARGGMRLWFANMTPSILRVSGNSLLEEILVAIGFLTYIGMLGRFGTDTIAAHGSAVRIESISYTTGWGVAVATSTMVGQAMGARRLSLARRLFTLNTSLAVMAMGFMGILFVAMPAWFLGWFDLEGNALRIGVTMMLILGLEQMFMAAAMAMTGGLRGAGDTFPAVVTQLFGVIGMRLGMGWYLAFHLGWGFEGLYWATLFDWMMRSLVLGILVWRGKWQKARV